MNPWLVVRGLTCMLALAPLCAQADDDAGGARLPQTPRAAAREDDAASRTRGHLTLRPFFRNDELRFTIDGGGVDIISELDWDDVRSAGAQLEGKLRLPGPFGPFELSGDLAYGRIYDGSLRDSDYAGNHKTLEFSRSRSDTERGSTLDVSLALGRPFSGRRWIAIPLLGICYSEENYNIRNGVQLVPATGPFAGLDSDYETRRLGVLWGAELHWLPSEEWDLMARLTSRSSTYDADGHFNLRSDLAQPKSFEQDTVGRTSILELQVKRDLGAGFTLDLATRWDRSNSRHGRMEFFFSSGGSSRQGLNEVVFESFRASLGLGYSF